MCEVFKGQEPAGQADIGELGLSSAREPVMIGSTIGNMIGGAISGKDSASRVRDLMYAPLLGEEENADRASYGRDLFNAGQTAKQVREALKLGSDYDQWKFQIVMTSNSTLRNPFELSAEPQYAVLQSSIAELFYARHTGFNPIFDDPLAKYKEKYSPDKIISAISSKAKLAFLDSTVGLSLKTAEITLNGADLINFKSSAMSAQLLYEFRTGTGPEIRFFGPDDVFTKDFSSSPSTHTVVANTLRDWNAKTNGMLWKEPYTGGKGIFGPIGFLSATMYVSPAAHVIGGFRLSGRVENGNMIRWTATNMMSVKSFFADQWTKKISGGSFIENNVRPERYGNTYQTIEWLTDLRGGAVTRKKN